MRSQLTIDLASKTTGLPIAGATATVKTVAGANATLYAGATGGTTVANPLVTDANGMAQAWLERGKYRIVWGGGVTRPDEWIDEGPADDAGIDAAWLSAGWSQGLLSARPAPGAAGGAAGARYYATDDWGGSEYVSTGAAWILVQSKNQQVLDLAAAATGTFSGLNGDVDDSYDLIVRGARSAAADVLLRPNGDAVAANYNQQRIYGQGASMFADRPSLGGFELVIATGGGVCTARATLAAKTGVNRVFVGHSGDNVNTTAGLIEGGWLNTATNITSLTLAVTPGTFTGRAILRRLLTP